MRAEYTASMIAVCEVGLLSYLLYDTNVSMLTTRNAPSLCGVLGLLCAVYDAVAVQLHGAVESAWLRLLPLRLLLVTVLYTPPEVLVSWCFCTWVLQVCRRGWRQVALPGALWSGMYSCMWCGWCIKMLAMQKLHMLLGVLLLYSMRGPYSCWCTHRAVQNVMLLWGWVVR